ncbi:MAG: DNA primase [Eubacteriales bacterium]|nr:DNA primase [Eubacteriales bacterium]
MGYSGNIVEEIKSRCNIVDVIGRTVSLKKMGINHKGLCPFHNEKTPSFIVSEERQHFTCYGCGATGDVIEFVQRYHNLDFFGAVERLAGEYGIDLEKSGYAGEGKKERLYEINREAAAYFYKVFTENKNPGRDYMEKRGFTTSTLRKFGIGYADPEWHSLYEYLTAKGVEKEHLLALGLISESKGKLYDKYRNRVMFPIINTRGKVIGFGGRAIGDDTPKYLNSQESSVFLKKNNLYGLNLTRQEINKEDCAILVEGYIDVMSLYHHGVRNVAASLGTALTENQAAMLKRYTSNIVLSYDADSAGQAATLRGMDILYNAGCKVRVLHQEECKDPDEYIKKNGKEAFLDLVKAAKPFAEYKLDLLRDNSNISTTEGRVNYLKAAAKILKALSPIEADAYVRKIAAETRISEGAIRQEIFGRQNADVIEREQQQKTFTEKKLQSVAKGHGTPIERNLIKLMLVKSDYVPKLEPYVDAFKDPDCFHIYQIIRNLYLPDEEIDTRRIFDSLLEEEAITLKDIMENVQLADKDSHVFEDCIDRIKGSAKNRRMNEIIEMLSVLDEEKDGTAVVALTKELQELQREKNRGEII